MIVYIAGINHFDPTNRETLRRWLATISSSRTSPPVFVATEWNKEVFENVKEQRPKFRQLMMSQWPDAPSELLDILENSLGYEADTHTEVFDDVEILWLDQKRQVNVSDINNYARDRLRMYRSFLEGQPLPKNTSDALSMFSEVARRRAQNSGTSTQRDVEWARLIREKCAISKGEWIIIIVGASHASDHEGSMRRLLQEQGLICQVNIF